MPENLSSETRIIIYDSLACGSRSDGGGGGEVYINMYTYTKRTRTKFMAIHPPAGVQRAIWNARFAESAREIRDSLLLTSSAARAITFRRELHVFLIAYVYTRATVIR